LSGTPLEPVTLAYRVVGIEAQNECPVPDFEAAEGQIEWPAGVSEVLLRVWVGDDDLAETDERFQIQFDVIRGMPASGVKPVEIVIADDDRTGLVDARAHGLVPGSAADQSAALSSALSAAAALGRGVVVMAPGDYELSGATLPPGVTLSGRGARLHRPALSDAASVTLRIEHAGAADSAPSLVEGLTIDGRREEQGPYRAHEREDAHLIAVSGRGAEGGRVRSTLERLVLLSGTGSGVMIGPNSRVTVCDLEASELWRDAVTAVGGNSAVRLQNVDATASEGTGLWLGARSPGFGGAYGLEVEADNVRVSAGDVEIEAAEGSRIALRRLVMTEPPFRLDAPGGSVRIADSVLMLGLTSEQHDYIGRPHDVAIERTTIVLSELSEAGPLEERARSFAALSLRAESLASGSPAPGRGLLAIDRCRFEIGREVEPDDSVFALENTGADVSVIVEQSELESGFAGWFAPNCADCLVRP
jgi:hypothetical protein